MKHWITRSVVAVLAGTLAVAAAAQKSQGGMTTIEQTQTREAELGLKTNPGARNTGQIKGIVKDQNGNPWAGIEVVIASKDVKGQLTVTTDSHGKYYQAGLPAGNYTIDFKTPGFPIEPMQFTLHPNSVVEQDLDLKELLAKNPKAAEAIKKREAEKSQFAQMKTHFDAGIKAITQATALQGQIASQPATQQAQSKQQIAQLGQTAVTELTQAETIAGPKDSNLPIIVGNLGHAYELAGNHAAAADAYAKALELKPTDAGFLLAAATNLAAAGKLQEANADCEKMATLPQPETFACWQNIGIVLYNGNQLQAAVEPLQKATQANPSDADTWYLLGTALMNTMQSKMVNGRLTAVVAPGTVEAYQKYLDLAPTGAHAAEAKAALQALQQLGAGVNTKYLAPKKH